MDRWTKGIMSALTLGTAVVLLAGDGSAQEGFHLGVHLNGTSVTYTDGDETDSGGGIGFRVGWGFSPNLTAFLGADAANVDDGSYTMGQGDLGVRYHFVSDARRGAPYLDAAFTALRSEVTMFGESVEATGPAFSVGGGYMHFLRPTLALDVGARLAFGEFISVSSGGFSEDIEEPARTVRVNLGISWFSRGG